MSVPKERRSESPMQFIDTAEDLAIFSYKRCKKFPNRWGHEIRDEIEKTALDILTNAKRANSVYVRTPDDVVLRRRYLMIAYTSVQALVSLINVANGLFPLCGYLNHAEDGSKKRSELSAEDFKTLEEKEKQRSREILEQWSALAYKEEGLLGGKIKAKYEKFKGVK